MNRNSTFSSFIAFYYGEGMMRFQSGCKGLLAACGRDFVF